MPPAIKPGTCNRLSSKVIAEIKQKMLAAGATCALMSGSGPTVFAVAEKKEITERILTELSELDLETAVTTTVQKERI